MMTPEVMPISESTDTKTLEKVRDNSGFGRWLQWGLVGVIFIFCALFLDFGEIFETLSGISFWWLVGILILMTLDSWPSPNIRSVANPVPTMSRLHFSKAHYDFA